MTTAVLIMGYRRPEKLKCLIESIKDQLQQGRFQVIISIDGPKSRGDFEAVMQCRAIANSAQLPVETRIVTRETNLGLAKHVMLAVSDVLEKYEFVIVLEDDLEVQPGGLAFLNQELTRANKSEEVFSVSAFTPVLVNGVETSMSPYFGSWGWAIGRDAWGGFLAHQRGRKFSLRQRAIFEVGGIRNNTEMLNKQLAGKIDSWAIFAFEYCIERGLLNVRPPQSLVVNNGLDGTGTHQDNLKIPSVVSTAFLEERLPTMKLLLVLEFIFYWKLSSPWTRLRNLPKILIYFPALVLRGLE